MTLYEVNQQAYSQLPTLSETQIKDKTKELTKFLEETDAEYYMMLEPTGRYYTIYTYGKVKRYARLAEEIIGIAQTLGEIKAIEMEKDKVEFWISKENVSVCKMFALFDYDEGVIKVE